MKNILTAIIIGFLVQPVFAADIDDAAKAFIQSPVQQKLLDDMLSPEMLVTQMQAMAPNIPKEKMPQLVDIVSEELSALRDVLENGMAVGATSSFTVEEIEALTAFYNSPIGASAMGKMTPYMQAAMAAISPDLIAMQKRVAERVKTELK